LRVYPNTGAWYIKTSSVLDATGVGAYPSSVFGCIQNGCTKGYKPSPDFKPRVDWVFVPPMDDGVPQDAALDVWLAAPLSSGFGTELMIILNHGPLYDQSKNPDQTPRGSVAIGGAVYDVYTYQNSATYVAREQVTEFHGDLMAFFGDCTAKSVCSFDQYLQSIQAGFEMWRNGVGVGTKSFSVTAQ
jgi:hypothetical protein